MNKEMILKNLNIKNYYLSELPSLKVNGNNQATALCPFHDDSSPSLSVNLDTGVWNCFAGCGSGDIFKFYQDLKRVDFKTALKEIAEMQGIAEPAAQGKVVATFEYKDSGGKTLYIKERIEPARNGRSKEFIFKHLQDGKQVTGRGSEPILYNMPELSKSKYVFVVEGEAKVELLRKWGLTATCLDSGANSPFKDNFQKYFEGKEEVIILPDNDSPGRAYANKIAYALLGKVGKIKVVALPELKEAEDIIDWAKVEGNDKVKLIEIVNQTPEFRKPSPFISSIELVSNPNSEPLKWIVEGLLPSNSVTLIAGEPGSYKTWLALSLAKSVSEGEAFLNRQTKRMKVYYIDRENPRQLIINRLNMIGRAKDFIFWGLWSNPEPSQLGDNEYLEIAKEKPLIIFDTLLKFHQGDENSSRDMGIVSRYLTMLRDAGATVLVLHHKGKSPLTDYRGSSEIVGGVDIAYSLSKAKEEGGILSLKGIKNRFVSEPHLTIEVKSTEDILIFEDISREKERVREYEEKEKMLEISEIIKRFYLEQERYPNQGEILERVKVIQGRNEVVRFLSRGKGVYWNIEEGKQGSKIYIPLKASHLPDIYNKWETGEVDELLEITI